MQRDGTERAQVQGRHFKDPMLPRIGVVGRGGGGGGGGGGDGAPADVLDLAAERRAMYDSMATR